jgi:hypothetical protein
VLQLGVVRPAERIPVAEGHEERAGRANTLRCDPQEVDGDGNDAPPLQLGCDQTHGLITYGSNGDEERHVDFILFEPLNRLGKRIPLEATWSRDRSHEGEVAAVETPETPTFDELAQTIDGKGHVRIRGQALVIERLAPMVLPQIADVDIDRDLPQGRIAASDGGVERRLSGGDETRRGHEPQSTLRKRLPKLRRGDGLGTTPGIRAQEETHRKRELRHVPHTVKFSSGWTLAEGAPRTGSPPGLTER